MFSTTCKHVPGLRLRRPPAWPVMSPSSHGVLCLLSTTSRQRTNLPCTTGTTRSNIVQTYTYTIKPATSSNVPRSDVTSVAPAPAAAGGGGGSESAGFDADSNRNSSVHSFEVRGLIPFHSTAASSPPELYPTLLLASGMTFESCTVACWIEITQMQSA
jgi:hypothetical protein